MTGDCLLLSVPVEVRMLIYDYLFHNGGSKTIAIRNGAQGTLPSDKEIRRRRYHVLDRTFHRRCYETTYHLVDNVGGSSGSGNSRSSSYFCAPLMRANRQIYDEAVDLVYGRHLFDFASHIEAIEPFLSDLTAYGARPRVREVALYKRGPVPLYENDRSEWRSLCRFLRANRTVRKLRLTIQGGRPAGPWSGPREFSAADFQLLADIRHESLDWVHELAQVKGVEEIEVLPDVQYCPPPASTSMIVFAAFSASIERALVDFLRAQLRLA